MMDIFLRKLLNAFSRELSLQKTFIIGVFQGPKYATAPCVCVCKAITLCKIFRQAFEGAPCT